MTSVLPKGYILEHLTQVDSTNEEAKRRLLDGTAPDQLVIRADTQTQGKGRLGRQWVSDAGNLFFSLALRSDLPAEKASQLVFVSALATGEAIKKHLSDKKHLSYKWPNDILLNDNKIAGILLESSLKADHVEWLVVGIGVNISSFPDEVIYPAGCLKEAAPDLTIDALFSDILDHFSKCYEEWLSDGFLPIRERWLEGSAHRNKNIQVTSGKSVYSGTMQTLDDDGALIIKAASGSTHRIHVGDVS